MIPPAPDYPLLYQVHTRVVLTERGQALGRPATLDDLEDGWLDGLAARGFDWVWLLGVWSTGPTGRAISRAWSQGGARFRDILPDCSVEDVCGSPFAVAEYTVHPDFGGPEALARLRPRLHARGLKLMLDFVPNHLGPDHPWVRSHPEYFVAGSPADLEREPHNYTRLWTDAGPRILAHGRDPNFPGWPDTLQLNIRHAGTRAALRQTLSTIAEQCDGVRCDMAMLLLPEVFQRTWGSRAKPSDGSAAVDEPFWSGTIAAVRERFPDFRFLAEVYWDLEWTLQQQGFDWCYDKRLYDRLRAGQAGPVRDHLRADLSYQDRLARFLENHDEARAASVFAPDQHQAAALITYLAPGLRFFHEGQLEGRQLATGIHLARRQAEPIDPVLARFYHALLALLRQPVLRRGRWRQLEPRAAWPGNSSHEQFLAYLWTLEGVADPGGADERPQTLLIVVNYGARPGQGRVPLPLATVAPEQPDAWLRLSNPLGPESYTRARTELIAPGLYLDLPAWGRQVLAFAPAGPGENRKNTN